MNQYIQPARNYSTRNRKKYTRARRIGGALAISTIALSAFIFALFA